MVKIDFKDKIVNGSVPENLFLQTVTIGGNQKQTLNLYMQGLLYNPNDFSVEIIINSATGNFKKTLNPKQYFSIPYVFIYTFVNTGNGEIILYYSNSTYGQFSTGELINILGSVNIVNDISGTVNINNPSLNVLGSVNITNDISGSVEISNPNINILGSVNIENQVNTDTGSYSINNQENQTSGTNTYTYNPWNLSTSTTPSLYDTGNLNNLAFVQQNGARGYLHRFICYVYNPSSSSASTTIDIYLYTHLPENLTDTPINQFSFSTGTISANSGVWIAVYPALFWNFNTLVAIPQQDTGTTGTQIGIGIPSTFLGGNAHKYSNNYWNHKSIGFLGYWSIINTSVASLPVTVQGGEVTITSTRKNPISIAGSFTGNNGTMITPPINKKWKIRSIVLYWTANSTQTDYVEIQIVPNNVPLAYVLNLYYGSLSVTDGDSYGVDVAEYVQSRTNQTINGSTFSLTEQTVNKDFEMYATESLYFTVMNETASVDYYISYIEENIN